MKNLFKIALSAFAALAIVNCTTDTTEGVGPDYTGKTVKLTVNASLDESRTVIGSLEDGKYPVTWSETGEELSLAQVVNGSTETVDAAKALKSTKYAVSNNGKNAAFTFDVPQASGTKFDYIACYPYSALFAYYPNYADVNVTVPAEQTPSATSADAAASVMVATNLGNSTQPEDISLSFQHVVGYGKMTVKGLKANGTVTNMTLTAPEVEQFITGSYYYYYNEPEKSKFVKSATSRNYVSVNLEALAVDGSDDFDVWFAVLPTTLDTFTVTFTADGKLYTKECEKPISFVAGEVSAFTLNMSDVDADKDRTFELVTSLDQLKNEDNVLIVNIAAQKAMSSTQKPNNRDGADVVIVDGKTITSPAATVAVLTLGVDGSNYTFFDPANNGYLYAAGADKSNYLRTQATLNNTGRWTVTVTDAGVATIKCVDTATTRNWIRYNPSATNGNLFACYASGQDDVYLFREVVDEGGSEPEQPAEPKVFRKTTTLEKDKEYIIAIPYNGKTFLLANNGTAGAYDDLSLPAATVTEVGAAGFTAQGSTLTGDVTNYTFRYDAQYIGGYFWSTSMDNVGLYRQSSGDKLILCSSNRTAWKTTDASGNATTMYYNVYGIGDIYLTVNADEQHAALVYSASTVTFYEESDGTVEPEPEEPEEPEEEAVEYSKITTNNLPVGTTATPNSTPVIITLTKGGSTYILYNIPPEGDMDTVGTLPVTSKTLSEANFTTTNTGISGPISKYTWDATEYSKQVYKFNSTSRTGDYAMLVQSSKYLGYTSNQYGTNYALLKVDEEGNYRLKHNTLDYYMSVDESGNLVTADNENDAALVNLYGQPDAVAEQEETEANSTGPVFNAVSTVEVGKTYIVVGYVYGDYALGNDASFTKLEKDKALTAENYANFTFKVTAGYTGCIYLQSTATNQYLRVNNNVLSWNQYTTGSNWKYDNKKLVYAGYGTSSSPYLCCTMMNGWTVTTNANDTGTQMTFYEVVE